MPPIKGSLISQDEFNSRKFSNFGPSTVCVHGATINKHLIPFVQGDHVVVP